MRLALEKYGIIIFTIMFFFCFLIICGCLQKKQLSEDYPTFQPGNKDSLSYEEMKQLMENYTSPTTIPETEMAWIIFSKTWFEQHDENSRPDIVQISFPTTWLNDSPVSDNEPVILLQVPKKFLELNDVNSDPEIFTVSFPAGRFKEFPNVTTVILT
jgi:hypothetical protein